MTYLKDLRKSIKSTFLFNIFQNFFYNPKKTYSDSFGEDLFVNNYFLSQDKGIYVDIGCNQPKINSLTYLLYKKGWRGINCDISKRCIRLYKLFRSKDANLNISVGQTEKKVKSFIFYENCTMNTVDKEFSNYTLKSVNKEPEIRIIKQKTLNQILIENNIRSIDYLNIDVEGYEMEVLKGFSINKYYPKLVSIEIHDDECPPIKNKIYMFFIKKNYKLVSIYGWTYFFEYKKNSKVHFKIQ